MREFRSYGSVGEAPGNRCLYPEPELEWEYGYFAVWALFVGVVGIMFYFFKKKNWF
jgi:hypothetical protein